MLIRAALLCLAASGLLLALLVGPGAWRGRPLEKTADTILAGGTIELATLQPTLTYIERTNAARTCTTGEPTGAAIVQHYALEQAYSAAPEAERGADGTPSDNASDNPALAPLIERARRDIRRALACRPHQPYLWYALFRVEQIADTPLEQSLPLLAMSYRLGPYEGWLMPQRNFEAAGLYDQLPPDLQARVRTEFALLARDDVEEASIILALRDDARLRQELLSSVASLPLEKRRSLASRLDALEVPVDVPGVDYDASRPWRKRS